MSPSSTSEPSAAATGRGGTALRALLGIVAGWLVTLGVVTSAGLAVTSYGDQLPLLASEDEVNRDLVDARTPAWDGVSEVVNLAGDTSLVAPAALVAVLLLRWVLGRWRESLFVAAAVAGHWAVFLTTTLLVDRERPDVPMLEEAPETSSFPSGHTGAALALYAALAVVVVLRVRTRWIKVVAAAALVAIPVLVGASRLYGGMHHPSDLVGSVLSSGLVIFLAYVLVLRQRSDQR